MTNAVAELLSIASDIAREGGALAARLRVEGVSIAASKSSDEDIVTFADREVETFIREKLSALRPNDGFFGEEGARDTSSSGLTWVVDPIDGTVNYLYQISAYGVSVAVVEGDPDPRTWTALAGAVMSPVAGELFTASNGGGSSVNDRPIHVNENVPLNLALVATGFSYSADVRGEQADALTRLLPKARDIRRLGACSIDLCSLAAGRVDAYFERELSPWDYAAGALIAREAGARVEGLGGNPATSEMLIATHPSLFATLHDVIKG